MHFVVRVEPHRRFIRKGDNLYYRHTISLAEALLGFTASIEHLDGHNVTLQRSGVTQPNQVVEYLNEGMPKHDFPSEFGTLFVDHQVYLPSHLSPEQKDGAHRWRVRAR